MIMTAARVLCGFGCGVLSAWGVGGGTLLLAAAAILFGVEQRTAQGINLLFFLPTAAGALYSHIRAGNLDRPTVRAAVVPALLCSLAGAWWAVSADTALLRRPFGMGLVLCGAWQFFYKTGQTWPDAEESNGRTRR